MVYTIDLMSFVYTRVKGQLGEVKELISGWWRGRISWISNTHRHRDFAGSQTTEPSWNNNHDDTGAGSQLPKLYLTKVIILSNFLCVSSCRSGCGASILIANKPHDLCGELEIKNKSELSAAWWPECSWPLLPSSMFAGRSTCKGDLSPCCLRAVTDPPQMPGHEDLSCPPKKSSFS